MGICIYVTDSLWCTPEINIINKLYSNKNLKKILCCWKIITILWKKRRSSLVTSKMVWDGSIHGKHLPTFWSLSLFAAREGQSHVYGVGFINRVDIRNCGPQVLMIYLGRQIIHICKDLTVQLSSGHRTGKVQFSFQSQRKAMPKNAQTTAQLHSSHTLVK